ncbi:MAG: hypothetical protein ACFFCE_00265 [Promethearchaeota archaeon]
MKNNSKKKGKYQPFSYFIEQELIFYNSLNQKKNVLAFGILQTRDISNLIQILNNFIKKSCLNSYTIQIGMHSETHIILKYICEEKKEIVQDYSKLCELLNNKEIPFCLLENNLLEMEFLGILRNGNAPKLNELKISISNSKNGLSLKNDKYSINYFFYDIKLDLVMEDIYFFQHIKKFLKEREIKFHLFLYNTLDEIGDLRSSAYLTIVAKEENSTIDLIKVSNEFFKKNLLDLQKPKISLIWQLLWRLPIKNKLTRIDNNFILEPENTPLTQFEILTLLEKNLLEKHIKYELVKDSQMVINQNWLFSIFSNLNLNKFSEIIKNNINQYHIYVLVIDYVDYSKLVSYDNITEINNLTIINLEEFLDLDYALFK